MYPFTFIFGGTSKFLGVQSLTLHLGIQRKLTIGPGSHVEYPTGTKNSNFVEDHTRNIPAKFGSKSENGLCLLSPPHLRVLKNGDPHYLVLQATSITKFYLTILVNTSTSDHEKHGKVR
jgi:hypothetical protein